MRINEELYELIDNLNNRDIPYALCGGLAMAVHGWPRATMDIDIMVEEESLEIAREIARELGFSHDSGEMVLGKGSVRIHRLVKFVGEEFLPLDILIVTSVQQEIWDTRGTMASQHGPVSVVSAAGLIEMKEQRGSGTDQDDIRKLKGES